MTCKQRSCLIRVECPFGNIFVPKAIYVYKEKAVFLCDWENCPENEDCSERERTIPLKLTEEEEERGT